MSDGMCELVERGGIRQRAHAPVDLCGGDHGAPPRKLIEQQRASACSLHDQDASPCGLGEWLQRQQSLGFRRAGRNGMHHETLLLERARGRATDCRNLRMDRSRQLLQRVEHRVGAGVDGPVVCVRCESCARGCIEPDRLDLEHRKEQGCAAGFRDQRDETGRLRARARDQHRDAGERCRHGVAAASRCRRSSRAPAPASCMRRASRRPIASASADVPRSASSTHMSCVWV